MVRQVLVQRGAGDCRKSDDAPASGGLGWAEDEFALERGELAVDAQRAERLRLGLEEGGGLVDSGEFAPGDRLLISCEARECEVAEVDEFYVYVRDPWLRPDPESRCSWDGTTAFARDPQRHDFDRIWHLSPSPAELRVGDTCQLSIPPVEVVVSSFTRFEKPEDVGWLPRPTAVLGVRAVSDERRDEDAVQAVYIEGAPVVIERHDVVV